MARDLNGTTQYITYTLAAGQTSASQITIAWWQFVDDNGQYRRPFHWNNVGLNEDTRMEYDDAWGFVFAAGWSTAAGKWSIAKPATGAWQHMAVTYNWGSTANDPLIYLNGSSQTVTDRVTPSGTAQSGATQWRVGADTTPANYFNGRIAEMAKWHRILTAAEIAGLGKALSPLHYPNSLEFYIPLIGRDTDESDLMYATSGTLTNSPAAIAHPRIIYPSVSQIKQFAEVTPQGVSFATNYYSNIISRALAY